MKQRIQHRGGFTLLELMLAIGILGIGMTLVMGVFPVAMRNARATNATQVGSIICKNGVQLAKLLLKEDDENVENAKTTFDGTTQSQDDVLYGTQCFAFNYPMVKGVASAKDITALSASRDGEPAPKYGGIVFYRKIANSRGYMIAVISYARQDGGAIVIHDAEFTATPGDGVTTLTGVATIIPDNSPVIFSASGKFSRIRRTDLANENRKYLSHDVNYKTTDGPRVIGISEAGNDIFSPALSTLTAIIGA
ncbi:MAG: type II secretion system protein [Phycisphaerales bacterium]|jgi:prepilin-type N-terminal cleavage/methylation domain-containing protein|nr:type II secretion system protein [Phycisphaerales bacterium]MBT7171317.1 type II secretion system protein [Phycisphaerales bacterium]